MDFAKRFGGIITFIAALVFILVGITTIPVGMHYDQMRYIVGPEQQLLGLFSQFSLRETVSNFFQFGYQAAVYAEFVRFLGNVDFLILIPRVVTGIFFLLTTLVWLGILRELGISPKARLAFMAVFLPSGLFIVYSKFLPLLGAYFFCISLFWYYLIRYEYSAYQFRYLVFAGICAILAMYTHAMAVFVVGITLLIFFCLHFFQKERRKRIIKNLPKFPVLFLIILVLSACAAPLFITFTQGDPNLSGKDEFTVFFLLEHGEYQKAATAVTQRVLTYINPQFLVSGGNMAGASGSTDPTFTANIKNPGANAYLLTNISPFGYITAILYVLFPLILLHSPTRGALFFRLILLTYLVSATIPNFDNPSLARMLPLYMFIPLGIAVIFDTIPDIRSRFVQNFCYFVIAGLIAGSAFINLSSIFSSTFTEQETAKFDSSVIPTAKYITNTNDLLKPFVYQDPVWNSANTLEFFYSPHVLENAIYMVNMNNSVQANQSTYITKTKLPSTLTKDMTGNVFSANADEKTRYVWESNHTMNCTLYPSSQSYLWNGQIKPIFKGSEESLFESYSYYPTLPNYVRVTNLQDTKNTYEFMPIASIASLSGKPLDLEKNVVSKTKGITRISSGYELNASSDLQSIIISLPYNSPGTYSFQVDLQDSATASSYVYIAEDTGKVIPYVDLSTGTHKKYLFSITEAQRVLVTIVNFYNSYLLSPKKYPVITQATDLTISQLSTQKLLASPADLSTVLTFGGTAPTPLAIQRQGLTYSLNTTGIPSQSWIVCPITYSPWISFVQNRTTVPASRVNGIGTGIQIENNTSETISMEFEFPYAIIILGLLQLGVFSFVVWAIATRDEQPSDITFHSA